MKELYVQSTLHEVYVHVSFVDKLMYQDPDWTAF